MPGWTAVCPETRLIEGEPLGVSCGEQRIALYRIDGRVYATSDICTHAFALLSTGFIDGCLVECPLHGAMFDVTSGRCEDQLYPDLKTYEVDIHDGEIYVNLMDATAPAGSP